MLTKIVVITDQAGTKHDIKVREMTVGEIDDKVHDVPLVKGMVTPEEWELIRPLPASGFATLVHAVIDLTYGTKASAGN